MRYKYGNTWLEGTMELTGVDKLCYMQIAQLRTHFLLLFPSLLEKVVGTYQRQRYLPLDV